METRTRIHKLARLAINDITSSPHILRILHSQELVDHHLSFLIQQVLGHVFCVWEEADGGDVEINGQFLTVGEGEDSLASAVGLCVGDLGILD
jgi:hypothetical protein